MEMKMKLKCCLTWNTLNSFPKYIHTGERYDFDGKSREISFQIRFIAFEVNYVDFCFIQFNHCHVFQSISFLNP